MNRQTRLFIVKFCPNLSQGSQLRFGNNLILSAPSEITLTAFIVPPEKIALSLAGDFIGLVEYQFRVRGMDLIFDQDDDLGLAPEVLQHVRIRAEMARPIDHTSGENEILQPTSAHAHDGRHY